MNCNTRNKNLPAIFLVRSEVAKAALGSAGAEHVIVTGQGFEKTLAHWWLK
ncbi:hypothetical protein AWB64_06091 [Caballeronia sordidicola]|uniref:Uncharacterized protein n=1 Tax=Caballeronia sordidicola TaxID=196367 RepID=A0A158IFA1_CABSO|nr:hypothetical protein [Caballeronia sordidicola]SAL55254.1 hypothetical protein AWB64_06091 [Caballeronia sordidicola]